MEGVVSRSTNMNEQLKCMEMLLKNFLYSLEHFSSQVTSMSAVQLIYTVRILCSQTSVPFEFGSHHTIVAWLSSAQQVGCLCVISPLHGFNYHLSMNTALFPYELA